MGFFNNSETENISARITNKGRQKIAEGNFNIVYFQIGDSEYDYAFSELDGTDKISNPSQKVYYPLDKDATIKYPYKLSESSVTGTTYGNPIPSAETIILSNYMGPAGFVSDYDITATVGCDYVEIAITKINGTNSLQVPTGHTFYGCEFITIAYSQLNGTDPENPIISNQSNSLIYKVISATTGATYNTITLDRNMPNLTGFAGYATVMCNKCDPFWGETVPYQTDCTPVYQTPEDTQDPWTLNIVWSQKPAGMDVPSVIDEELSGYTSNVFVSTKEFFGYNSTSGQSGNTTTTIINSLGDIIVIPPNEQHSLGIVHYAGQNSRTEPDKFFKYEDYIGHNNVDEMSYFEIFIPFLLYHRSLTNIGARFFMGPDDHYINSNAQDSKMYKIKYRYLIDENGYNVGKIFLHNSTIVFDDQEIVAALDYKSNRKYTLPAPRVSQIPTDIKCNTNNVGSSTPLMAGTTGETMFITYLFAVTGNTGMTGMHCNYYSKVTGTSLNADVAINFSTTDFIYMTNILANYKSGYIADKFCILAQMVTTGEQPSPDGWRIIDFTDEIPNHTLGYYIDPLNIQGARFVLTHDEYDNADKYDIEDYLGSFPDEPSTSPEFGDTEPFPGSVRLVRSTDVHTMRFLVNLPSGQFTTTQNPTYISGKNKKVTEIALLNGNKDVMVIAKTTKPVTRVGTQVFGVKIDF